MIAPQTVLQNRYLVIKQIGQGGMGAVYLATDQRFGSTVALKETFFTDPKLRKAFEREAQLLNRLRHPALPNVSDHFIEGEGQFLVMEYIPGDDLSEMLKAQGGAFPVKDVLDWADQLLDALDYLHTQEIPVIHRDIKPQNLKLTPRGQIILLDFGLAKGTPLQLSQATASGSVFGYSRNYAPIEQIQGTGTDPRSDLYSLAATLYHLMTGSAPPDALARATDVLNGQPDPLRSGNTVHGQITPAIAQVLMSAMSQNAGQRPQTALAMRRELSEAGKQTLVTGNATNAQAIAAGTILEQQTQLIEKQSAAIGASQYETDSLPANTPATTAEIASPTKSGGDAPSTSVETPDSENTEFRQSPGTKRSISGRSVGIVAGALVILAVAAIVFAMTRRPSTPTADTQTPTNLNNPAANNQRPEQTNTNPDAQNATPNDAQRGTTQNADGATRTTKGAGTSSPPKDTTSPRRPNPPDSSAREDRQAAEERRARERERENNERAQIAEEERRAMNMRKNAASERQRSERERRRADGQRRRPRMRYP